MNLKRQDDKVRAKKHLGQHFLKDEQIAFNIVKALSEKNETGKVLEIGPGMGVLTQYLLQQSSFTTYAIDIDKESIAYLKTHFPALEQTLIDGDFLQLDLQKLMGEKFALIGNFPYNISSQIVFKVIDNREIIPLMVGMFQREVALRLGAKHGNKDYGILTVLAQAYYDIEYLFTVDETVFNPPPKVKSAVIRMIRRTTDPDVEEKWLFRVVKAAFNQRRKKLRNALQQFQVKDELLQQHGYLDKRAEELSVNDFIQLTKLIVDNGKDHD